MTRNIVITLECFVKKENKYLMLHRNPKKRIMPGVWMAPGGHREFNEGLFAAARREVMEETGLSIKNIRIKATGIAYVKDIDQEFCFHMLKADYAEGKLQGNPEDGDLVWLTKDEMAKLDNLLPELKEILPHILSDNEEVVSYTAYYTSGTVMDSFILEQP